MDKDYGYVYLKSPSLGLGYSRCYIPTTQNGSAGGQSSSVWAMYRVLGEPAPGFVGDAFDIGYDNVTP